MEGMRKLRRAKELTQKQLADLCGLAPCQICCYEKGDTMPRWDTAEAIAKALNCTVKDLF